MPVVTPRTVADRLLVERHARFVAAEEWAGMTRIVLRAADGTGRLESTLPMRSDLAWACVATALQADDLLAAARDNMRRMTAPAPAPRTVVEPDVDDLLDFDGEPFPFTDEQPWRTP